MKRLLLWLLLVAVPVASQVLYRGTSPYNAEIVVEQTGTVRALRFGNTLQSIYDRSRPNRLVAPYTRLSMLGQTLCPSPQRVLMIGLGGGSIARSVLESNQNCQIDAVEIDPVVVQLAHDYFDLPRSPRLRLIVADGRRYLEETSDCYDLIFLDAYGDGDVPRALKSEEFLEVVKAHLDRNGLVVANLWGSAINPSYCDMVKTYAEVFREIHTVRAWPDQNRILLAFPQPTGLTRQALVDAAGSLRTEVLRGYEPWPDTGTMIRD